MDAIPVRLWNNRAARQAETGQSPCYFGRSLSSFLRQRGKRPGRDKPWVRTQFVLPRPGDLEENTIGPKYRGLGFPEGDVAGPYA